MSEAAGEPAPPNPSKCATPGAAKAIWRDYCKQTVLGEVEATMRIGVAASFTTNTLVPLVGSHLLESGIRPEFTIGPYNQIFQVCIDHQSYFGTNQDAVVLLWRIDDIMIEEASAFLVGDETAYARAIEKVNVLTRAISALRAAFAGTIIVNVPPFPSTLSSYTLDLANPKGLGAFHRAIANAFVTEASDIRGIRFCDLDALEREFGLSRSFDARQWYLYHQPFSERFLFEAGALIARIIAALNRSPRKCVVLDCDNTLWGGVVGEDGVGGIQIGDDFPGSAFRDFQKLLLHWRNQGVLLALASKNNEADVWEVFENHSGMVLKREHISAWQINWNPKADNIPAIAKTLNIGIDSLVFVDDNPMEIEYMRKARPAVLSKLIPDDPAEILQQLRALTCFDRLDVTQEDRHRAEMMRAEQQRESLGQTLSKEQFQQSLDLRLEVFSASGETYDRIAQLINKTNQFNLTTIRRSVDEVRALAASGTHQIFGVRVSDKFGDYGLTGVAIVERHPAQNYWTIDTFLLSCRVLGRGVETALLGVIANEANAEGACELRASFVPTTKNAPAAYFLPDHGFQPGGEQTWRMTLPSARQASPYITIVRS